MITVACVWVKANVPYGVEYVINLRAMVARHLPREHQFVCLTDRPWLVPSAIATKPVPSPGDMPGWWSKLRLFSPSTCFIGRVLYLDLDTLVVSSLEPVVDYPSRFALVPDGGTFKAPKPYVTVKRFNSSVMVWDAGYVDNIYEGWTPDVAERLWGDQDYIGEQMPWADTMPAAWFPRLSSLSGAPPDKDAIVVLAKKPKNHVAAKLYSWVDNVWKGAA